MARYRPIRTQRDAAVVLAEDFARAARSMGDMPNFYRWRNVAAQHRVLADIPLDFNGRRIDYIQRPPPWPQGPVPQLPLKLS